MTKQSSRLVLSRPCGGGEGAAKRPFHRGGARAISHVTAGSCSRRNQVQCVRCRASARAGGPVATCARRPACASRGPRISSVDTSIAPELWRSLARRIAPGPRSVHRRLRASATQHQRGIWLTAPVRAWCCDMLAHACAPLAGAHRPCPRDQWARAASTSRASTENPTLVERPRCWSATASRAGCSCSSSGRATCRHGKASWSRQERCAPQGRRRRARPQPGDEPRECGAERHVQKSSGATSPTAR